ncbi:MAG: hypothetical protein IJ612_06750 [Prevotella sp.]|nr:hypothetical protein [Prevotella sp.]
MKKSLTSLGRSVAGVLLCLAVSASAWANTRTEVTQVTDAVTLSDDVDYVITSTTPFGNDGVVDITNTDHAVLILSQVKPSAALKLLASHVTINGEKAVNGQNCQVKLYNRGAIIMPYSSAIRPLTVYSEPDFGGEECSDFGLEHTNGYMNTLTEAKLNNRIRSFKLKRGYMVTFSNRSSGRGYSRCFIAADKDLEVPELPGVLDRSISSYRIFTWYDTGKKNLANYINTDAMSALKVQSSYDWGTGNASLLPDYEWVPNHIYEDYPSSSAIGHSTWSPHTKNNNEPLNQSDDHPQDLTTILNNWENMMRTGLRLCTPASWDGSDYWNATGFLASFLDAIDERGWRCDVIDLHCYWAESNFGNIANWVNKYHRPVWISEWCWGASWNSNGAFASGVTEAQVRDALQRICTNLNNWDYVERYYYWNSERDPSKLYKNGKLTPAGEMYANLDGGVGYNGKYDYAPKVPTQQAPDNLTIEFDKLAETVTLSWHEYNGEANVSMFVQRKRGNDDFADVVEVPRKDLESNYTFTVEGAQAGDQYRISIVDANRVTRTSKTVVAVSNNLEAGDEVDAGDTQKYLGGNLLVNGDFDLGSYGWTALNGNEIDKPWFQVVPVGGIDGGSYLQSYANGSVNTPEQFIKTIVDVDQNSDYYYSGAFANGVITGGVYLSGEQLTTNSNGRVFNNSKFTDNTWGTDFKTFNTGDSTKVIFYFSSLKRKAQFDKQMLCKLFDTKEEALADGIAQARKRAEAFIAFNQRKEELNSELQQQVAAVTGVDSRALSSIQGYTANALKAYNTLPVIDSLVLVVNKLAELKLHGYDELTQTAAKAQAAATATDIVELKDSLQQAVDNYLTFTALSVVPESRFNVDPSKVWTTKCGTYTGGDQRINKFDNVSFWNAWWSGINASEGESQTMELKQDITNLSHGYYTLSCKAMTEHYCLSDQHAYITSGDQTAESPVLTADYYDLATTLTMPSANVWQKLTTTPVYVEQGGAVTIGFKSSKKGATDNLWHRIGGQNGNTPTTDVTDKREGWWGATEFVLNRALGYQIEVTPGQFYSICLPYAVKPTEGLHFYTVSGITADHENLCLSEVDEVAKGKPFIFSCDKELAVFSGFGAETKAPASDELLMGFFVDAKFGEGYYKVVDGTWQRLTELTDVARYTALIKKDVVANLVEIADWDEGPLMPITGADVDFANAVQLSSLLPVVVDGLYTIDGRRVAPGNQLRGGLYIKVSDGKARKVVIN